MEAVHKERLEEGIVLEIHQDDDPISPRENDNLGTMVCWHQQYALGDRQIKDGEYDSPAAIVADIVAREGEMAVMLPLYLYDHSGITMSTSDALFRAFDSAGWDWGKVGFIYVSKATVRKEYGGRATKEAIAEATEVLEAEVKEYDQCLTGDVYGFVIRNATGEVLASCWGFFGFDLCLEEAKEQADYYVRQEKGPQPVLGVL